VIADGLEHPWSSTWLPTQATSWSASAPGRLRIARDDGRLRSEAIPRLPELFAPGQGGLLEVAAHPDFSRNQLIKYPTYSAGSRQRNHTRLARARFNGRSLLSLEVVHRVPQLKTGSQHFGSRLLWLPDGTLLMSVGGRGNLPLTLDGGLIRRQAQNPCQCLEQSASLS